jgi:hypothetical protein
MLGSLNADFHPLQLQVRHIANTAYCQYGKYYDPQEGAAMP